MNGEPCGGVANVLTRPNLFGLWRKEVGAHYKTYKGHICPFWVLLFLMGAITIGSKNNINAHTLRQYNNVDREV